MSISHRQAHAMSKTHEALRAEVALPAKPVFPIHAGIALDNAIISLDCAIRDIRTADARVSGSWEGVSPRLAIQYIAEARRRLDEAEGAIKGHVL